MRVPLKVWRLYWAPEARQIAVVRASTAAIAIKRTPKPWSKYRGEVYVEEAVPK